MQEARKSWRIGENQAGVRRKSDISNAREKAMNAAMALRLERHTADKLATRDMSDPWATLWPWRRLETFHDVERVAGELGHEVKWHEAAGYSVGWHELPYLRLHERLLASWAKHYHLDETEAHEFAMAARLGQRHRRGEHGPALVVLRGAA